MKTVLLIITTLSISFINAHTNSQTINIEQPIYFYIEQISAKYNILFPNIYSKPYTRKQISKFLLKIKNIKSILNKNELSLYNYYIKKYSYTISLIDSSFKNTEKNLYLYQNRSKNDHLIIEAGFMDSSGYRSRESEKYTVARAYGGIRGAIRNKIGFFSEARIFSEKNSNNKYLPHDYNPVNGYPYNTFGDYDTSDARSWDTFRAGLFIENNFFAAEFGVDQIKWGPSEINPLTISGQTPPMGLLKLNVSMNNLNYTHLISVIMGEKYKDKYMYAHRLEINLPFQIIVGINEALIYGDNTKESPDSLNSANEWFDERKYRSFDPIYSIPFIPYFFAEHYNGDKENAIISFDIASYFIKNTKIYAEIFLDDLISPIDFFDNYWSNKWAITSGIKHFLTICNYNISFLAEYTRVEPWVYTHFYGESHNYRHYGSPIGYYLGPNSDELNIQITFNPNWKIHSKAFFKNSRKSNDQKGDNISDIHLTVDPIVKKFLGNNYDKKSLLGFQFIYRFNQIFNINTYFAKDIINSTDLNASLLFNLLI